MRVDRLATSGFATFTTEQVLDLAAIGPGIVAVAGPNGAGKTTLLEAIPGGIYRQTPSRGAIAGLATARDSRIEIVGESRGQQFRALLNVDALRSQSEAFLFDGGGDPVAGPKVREYDAAIAARFAPLSVYLAASFAAQTGAGSILRMPRAERRALFARLLGLDRLEALSEAAKRRAAAAEADLTASRGAVEALRASAAEVARLRSDLEREREEAVGWARARDGLQAEAQNAADALARLRDRHAEWTRADRQAAEAARRAHVAEQRALEAQAFAFRASEFLRDAKQIEEDAEKLRGAAAWLDDVRARVDAAQVEAERLRADERRAERALGEATSAAEATSRRVAELEASRLRYESARTAAIRATEILPCTGRLDSEVRAGCPAVSSHLAIREEADRALDGLDEQQKAADEANDDALEDLRVAREAAVESRRQREEHAARLAALADERAHATVAHQRLLQADRSAALASARVDAAAADATATELRRQANEAAEEAARAAAAVPQYDPEETRKAEVRDRDARAGLQAASRSADQAGLRAAAAEARLEAAEKAVAQAEEIVARVAPVEQAVADWRWLERGLGRQGVQALELDASGPRVSDLANELLRSAYGPRFQVRFETQAARADGKGVRETFDVVVVDTERGREGDGADLSGGEKVIVGEALGLAVGIFHGQQAGTSLGTVVRDETVGALDPDNAERYLAMLRAFCRVGRVHQLLFVAHSPALVDLADAVVRVTPGRVEVERQQ